MNNQTCTMQFQDVRKAFTDPDSGYGIISHVSFRIGPGQCLSLLGENGSGKSTILRMACGLVSPDSGNFQVWGGDPARDGAVRARICAMFEGGRALYARMSPVENAAYFAGMKGFAATAAVQRLRQLSARFAIEQYNDVVVRKMSRGTQQKFSLLCALSTGAALWILDEPTLGMDSASVDILADVIRDHLDGGGTVLMATHDAPFASALGMVKHMTEFMAPSAQAPMPLFASSPRLQRSA